MPSVRELQRTLHASPVTVQRAMQRLAAEGLVSLRPGSGTFVSVPPHLPPSSLGDVAWQTPVLGRAPEIPAGLDHLMMAATGDAIVLDNGFPDSTLHPVGLLGAAAGRAARRSAAWVRVAPEGITELRALFAAELGPSWSERNVVVTLWDWGEPTDYLHDEVASAPWSTFGGQRSASGDVHPKHRSRSASSREGHRRLHERKSKRHTAGVAAQS